MTGSPGDGPAHRHGSIRRGSQLLAGVSEWRGSPERVLRSMHRRGYADFTFPVTDEYRRRRSSY